MKIIDARSGTVVAIGDTITYPGGESMRLVDAQVGLFSGEAVVETVTDVAPGQKRRMIATVPLTVRWMHPRFFLQHVAFIPS